MQPLTLMTRPLSRLRRGLALALAGVAATSAAQAEIHIGVIVSSTGPGASLGIPAEQAIRLWPAERAGEKPALDFVQRFDARQGAGSRSLFAATAWDALLMLQQAAREALKKARPGTPEFRSGLRDAFEGLHDFVGAQGVFNMSPADHNGVDQRSQVMVRIEGGAWKLQP